MLQSRGCGQGGGQAPSQSRERKADKYRRRAEEQAAQRRACRDRKQGRKRLWRRQRREASPLRPKLCIKKRSAGRRSGLRAANAKPRLGDSAGRAARGNPPDWTNQEVAGLYLQMSIDGPF